MMLPDWKGDSATAFLSEAPSQALQQALKNLDRAYVNFFEGCAERPRFKKKGRRDSFRYPQGFKIDCASGRVFLPKLGWMRYRKSRDIAGTPKQITVSLVAGKWYVSIQTERVVAEPTHLSASQVGLDMGVARLLTYSDGTHEPAVNVLRIHQKKLAKEQRKLSRKTKFSNNWRKQKARIARLHKRIADTRADFLHKLTTTISKNHALVVMEDLRIKNMTRSASGSLNNPGRNVRAKSGLNKAILDQGWGMFRTMLEYKLAWAGGELRLVSPHHTSQRCSACGHTAKESRISQECFVCVACGLRIHADHNASLNILAAGLAATACGAERACASVSKQEPTRVAA
jgi:putative transposase